MTIGMGFGILFVLVGLFFVAGQVRAWPPGTYRPGYLHQSTWGDFVLALFVVATCLCTGAALLMQVSYWWVALVGGIVLTMLVARVIGVARYRQ